MRRLSQMIKDLSPEEILRRIDHATRLMGVIVEKLDEIYMKLDSIERNISDLDQEVVGPRSQIL